MIEAPEALRAVQRPLAEASHAPGFLYASPEVAWPDGPDDGAITGPPHLARLAERLFAHEHEAR